MAIEPRPSITKAGRYLFYTISGIAAFILLSLLVQSCIRRPVTLMTQGYDTPQGQYMEPDHGFFYYYFWSRVMFGNVQPSYHVYYPPVGAPTGYRPWHEREYYRDSSGRFTKRPPIIPSTPLSVPTRSNGGFSPTYSTPSKSYSTPGFSSTPSRSTGGFSSSKPSSTPSKSYSTPSRSSGGFSKSSGSPSRSSGGFSSGRKK